MRTRITVGITAVVLIWSLSAQAQPPENAALLYYQAFLVYEKPSDDKAYDSFVSYVRGKTERSEAITEHLKKSRTAIDLAVKAAKIDTCNWGYDYTQGFDLQMPNLSQFRRIAFLIAGDTRWQAEQGNYATAVDRCIALRRMAVHAADKTLISYLVGIALNTAANRGIERLLSTMPVDAKLLTALKDQLNQTQAKVPTFGEALANEAEVCVVSMYKDKSKGIVEMAEKDDPMAKRLRDGDEAFFKRNRDYYNLTIKKLIDASEQPLPYDQMCPKLEGLTEQFSKDAEKNPDATLTAMSIPAVRRVYELKTREETHTNAVIAAIDVYLAKAKTGQLPNALPAGAPLDLFSGKPFKYAKTAKGFTLSCQAKEAEYEDPYEYEFTVR